MVFQKESKLKFLWNSQFLLFLRRVCVLKEKEMAAASVKSVGK
jgi:hypothetical protein